MGTWAERDWASDPQEVTLKVAEAATHDWSLRSFDDVILAPPLPAVAAVLILLGLVAIGGWFSRRLASDPDSLDRVTGFLVGITATLSVLEIAGVAGVVHLVPLRCVGILLGGLGVAAAPALLVGIWRTARARLRQFLPEFSTAERIAGGAMILTVAGLSVSALGPVTDADSVAYHLAVPLEWLRRGGATPLPDCLAARLVGLGENLNLLGLACGTDSLNAVVQAASLILILAIFQGFSRTRTRGIAVATVVTSIPVWGFLVPSQKPQLLPIAANLLAFGLILEAQRAGESRRLHLAAVPIALAVACKTSFILTSGPLLALAFFVATQRRCVRRTLVWTLGSFAAVVGPVWIRRFALYGNPISPFLEPLRGGAADPLVVRFAALLHDYSRVGTAGSEIERLASLFVPRSLGLWSTSLGPMTGVLLLIAVVSVRRNWPVIVAAATAGASTFCLGQPAARFLVEPILWLALALAAKKEDLRPGLEKSAWCFLASSQAIVCGVGACLFAWSSIQGAATARGRRAVMGVMTAGYEENLWINASVPSGATIISRSRFHLFLRPPHVFGERLGLLPVEEEVQELDRSGKTTGGVRLAADPTELARLAQHGLRFTAESGVKLIPLATRNPANRTRSYELQIVRIGG